MKLMKEKSPAEVHAVRSRALRTFAIGRISREDCDFIVERCDEIDERVETMEEREV